MSRRDSLLLLLGSLDDVQPAPAGSMRTVSGFGPVEKRPCDECTQDPGWITDRFNRREPCLACGGVSGDVQSLPGRGWVSVDPMDSLHSPVQTAAERAPSTRPVRMADCDACGGDGVGGAHLDDNGVEYRERCERCGGSGKVARRELTGERKDRGPTVGLLPAEVESLRSRGSYAELEAELARLPVEWRRLVRRVCVDAAATDWEPAGEEAALLELSLMALEAALPDRLKVPVEIRLAGGERSAWLQRVKRTRGLAKDVRDKEIRREIRRGRPTQHVAREYGLSVSQVNRVAAGDQVQV